MKHISYIILFVAGMIVAGCQQSELLDTETQQSNERILTLSVSMPVDNTSLKMSITPDSNTPYGFELTWENDDTLKLNFEYNGNFYSKYALIDNSSINGKSANFIFSMPEEIPTGDKFNLYAVFQDNKYTSSHLTGGFEANSINYNLIRYEYQNLVLSNNEYKVAPLLWWSQKDISNTATPEINPINLEHAGWMMALHIKNNSASDISMPKWIVFEGGYSWLWNGHSVNIVTFNPGSGTFSINGGKQQSIRFTSAEYNWNAFYNVTIEKNETVTMYRWLAGDNASPQLQLRVMPSEGGTSISTGTYINSKAMIERGMIYHVNIEWDGTNWKVI